ALLPSFLADDSYHSPVAFHDVFAARDGVFHFVEKNDCIDLRIERSHGLRRGLLDPFGHGGVRSGSECESGNDQRNDSNSRPHGQPPSKPLLDRLQPSPGRKNPSLPGTSSLGTPSRP